MTMWIYPANLRDIPLGSALKQIPAFDQRAHLTIRHTALQHPESAVGVDVAQTACAQRLHHPLDARGDEVGRFYFVVFDIDQADAECDFRIQIGEDLKLVVTAPRKFQYEMIGVQRVEEWNQI